MPREDDAGIRQLDILAVLRDASRVNGRIMSLSSCSTMWQP
jgi:hypothetical protein